MTTSAYWGLKRRAMCPVYGLAEASLAVAFPEPGVAYRWVRVNRHKLGGGPTIDLNPADARDALELMCVGGVVPNVELRIADPPRAALTGGQVGHILIGRPSVTRAYLSYTAATTLVICHQGSVDT